MRIERNPWQAALHLRAVMKVHPNDDVLYALMGLCQALLGNFKSAVSSYRRALSITPRNPWYHHNLGHLLDVALAEPQAALSHLQSAHRLEPLEDEITASLAHCLAGTGELVEARALAFDAVRASPRNADHKALLAWVERGAPDGEGPHARSQPRVERPSRSEHGGDANKKSSRAASSRTPEARPPHASARVAGKSSTGGVSDERAPIDQRPPVHVVLALLERNMRAAGLAAEHVTSAHAMERLRRCSIRARHEAGSLRCCS
ncbi:MAG: tetratricopeptide repeat protein [Sandaracinaceae bacterium]|nr:tetratricopeptide repeat protein [Sandaracinaceae bacterium]